MIKIYLTIYKEAVTYVEKRSDQKKKNDEKKLNRYDVCLLANNSKNYEIAEGEVLPTL